MDIQTVKQTLRGPVIPVVTYLNDDLSVDVAGIKSAVHDLIERGIVTGQGVLLAVGAGGDFNMLNVEERKAAARAIVDAAEGRAPVLVGAQDTNVSVMLEMARYADDIGAYGIQFSTTYYYGLSDDDALRQYRLVHESTSKIAIMAYNTFWHGYDFPFGVLDELCKLERFVALKWARPDNGSPYMRGVARYSDRLAIVDNAGMRVMNHILGGTGFVSHLATIWPEHELNMWKLLEAGDYVNAQQEMVAVNWPWLDFRHKMGKRTSGESPPIKAAVELVGRRGGPCRMPSRSLTADERADLRELLIQLGVPNVV